MGTVLRLNGTIKRFSGDKVVISLSEPFEGISEIKVQCHQYRFNLLGVNDVAFHFPAQDFVILERNEYQFQQLRDTKWGVLSIDPSMGMEVVIGYNRNTHRFTCIYPKKFQCQSVYNKIGCVPIRPFSLKDRWCDPIYCVRKSTIALEGGHPNEVVFIPIHLCMQCKFCSNSCKEKYYEDQERARDSRGPMLRLADSKDGFPD